MILLNLCGRALGNFLAEFQHAYPVGNIHNHPHIMFNQNNTYPPHLIDIDDKARHVFGFLKIHAGHRFVQQQKLRLHRKRPGKFDPFLESVWQGAHHFFTNCFDFQ